MSLPKNQKIGASIEAFFEKQQPQGLVDDNGKCIYK